MITTTEILAYRALDREPDERWIEWALSMLEQGYDTLNLRMLSGITAPFSRFEIFPVFDRASNELGLSYSDKEQILQDFIIELLHDILNGRHDMLEALRIIRDLYFEMDTPANLVDLHLLSHAYEDLQDSDIQFYWEGAHRGNIKSIVY